MKVVGLVVAFSLVASVSLAKKGEKSAKKSAAVQTINTLKGKGGNIAFTCSPSNCREQEDGSLLFNLTCQTNKEGDKLEVNLGDKGQTIQSYGFVDIPGDLKAPKKGSVPIKISVSEGGRWSSDDVHVQVHRRASEAPHLSKARRHRAVARGLVRFSAPAAPKIPVIIGQFTVSARRRALKSDASAYRNPPHPRPQRTSSPAHFSCQKGARWCFLTRSWLRLPGLPSSTSCARWPRR